MLIDFFYTLRSVKLPVSVKEYLTLLEALQAFQRQALHAARLAFVHPSNGEALAFEAPMPADMQALITVLSEDVRAVGE